MGKPLREWKVFPHGPLVELEPDILTVVGEIQMPLMEFPRRMTLLRLKDGGVVVFNAIALEEDLMARIEAFGEPRFLIVPNDHHRLDAGIWKERYPGAQVVTPGGSVERVEEVVHVDTAHPRFDDPDIVFETVPGTGNREAAVVFHTTLGATLVLNDLVGNLRNVQGVGGWMLRLMGFASDEPRVPRPPMLTLISDKQALREQFERWSHLPLLRRILVSHGEPIEDRPAEALLDLARSLA